MRKVSILGFGHRLRCRGFLDWKERHSILQSKIQNRIAQPKALKISVASISPFIRRSAFPRWLTACFASGDNSAVVECLPSTRNSGSYPNPLLPRAPRKIVPSIESCVVSKLAPPDRIAPVHKQKPRRPLLVRHIRQLLPAASRYCPNPLGPTPLSPHCAAPTARSARPAIHPAHRPPARCHPPAPRRSISSRNTTPSNTHSPETSCSLLRCNIPMRRQIRPRKAIRPQHLPKFRRLANVSRGDNQLHRHPQPRKLQCFSLSKNPRNKPQSYRLFVASKVTADSFFTSIGVMLTGVPVGPLSKRNACV